jgi:hypothetical protein
MSDDLEIRLRDLLAERGRLEADSVELVLGGIDRLPARRAARSWSPLLAVAAVIVLALVGVAILAQVRGRGDVATTPTAPPPTSSTGPSASPTVSSAQRSASPSPALQSRPVWAVDLASHLDCDGKPSANGMDVPDLPSPFDPAETPEEALANIRIDYRNLPASGWTRPFVEGHYAVQRYLVDDRAKAHVVSTNQFPGVPSENRWQVVGLRMCDPSEFASADQAPRATTVWRDAAGDPVRTDVVTSRLGSGHCGWQLTVFLTLGADKAQYFRDPHHDLADYSVVTFDPDATLPKDAVDTGLHTDEWHLFTIPSGRAVFVRTPSGTIERWPRATELIGCA